MCTPSWPTVGCRLEEWPLFSVTAAIGAPNGVEGPDADARPLINLTIKPRALVNFGDAQFTTIGTFTGSPENVSAGRLCAWCMRRQEMWRRALAKALETGGCNTSQAVC